MEDKNILAGLKEDMYSHSLSVTGRTEAYKEESDFPFECFPPMIQDIVVGLRESMGFPIDYTSIAMLTAIATAIGSPTRIRNFDNWTEPCILFTVIVGHPGTNKSHPLSAMLKPLFDIDKVNYEKYMGEFAEYEHNLQIFLGKKNEDAGDRPERPVRRQIIADDVTIEALFVMMAENPRGLCICCDEFSSLLDNMDRYSRGSSEQAYLSIFNGKPISKNRKGEKMSLRIDTSFVVITGTVQQDIIAELMDGRRRKNGFVERLFVACPKKEVHPLWMDLRQQNSKDYYSKWNEVINTLYNESLKRMADGGRIITLSEEACGTLDKWQKDIIERLQKEKNGNMRDLYSKASIYILRFCLLLHELDNACNGTDKLIVSMFTVEKAIKLAEYFIQNSLTMIRHIYRDSLKDDEKDVYNTLPDEFRLSEGVKIATEVADWYERKMQRYLDKHEGTLFLKISHGVYRKLQ